MEFILKAEIFKSGFHTDSLGRGYRLDSGRLQQIAESYDAKNYEAPVVVGHPKDNLPAYGWVKNLSVENNSLFAEFGEVDTGFRQAVKDGRYKKISASFYTPNSEFNPTPNKWHLRHVGFLGAQPPAIKGLQPVAFSEEEKDTLIFEGEVNFSEILKTQESVQIEQPVQAEQSAEKISISTNGVEMEKQLAEMQKKLDEANSKLASLEKEKAKQETDILIKENADFAESLIKEGKILPVFKETVVKVLNVLSDNKTADFSENNQDLNSIKTSFKDYLNASKVSELIKSTDFENNTTSDFSEADLNSSDALNEQVLKIVEAKKISYEEALSQVLANMKGVY